MKMGYKGRAIAGILVVVEFCSWLFVAYTNDPVTMNVHRVIFDFALSIVPGAAYYWFGLQYDKVCYLAIRDTFTGLFNRAYMMKTLAHGLQKSCANGQTFSVLIVDVNHLKWVNDSFGHLAGDELISRVSNVLEILTKYGGIAGRLGGDEFLVIFPQFNCSITETIVSSIEYELTRVALERAKGHTPSVSIGISSYPEDGNTPHMLLKAADDRMYQHKAVYHSHFAP